MNKGQIIINGKVANFEVGHTEEEWNALYAENDSLWDVSVDDIIEGAIEPNEEIVYWYINGRLYETEKSNRVMKTYEVTLFVMGLPYNENRTRVVTIEAKSQEEAEQKAHDWYVADGWGVYDSKEIAK